MFKKIVAFMTLAVVGVVAVFVLLNFQYVQDVVSYRQFQPSETIASLANDSGMSDRGKFLFYVSHPSIEGPESFNRHCSKTEMTTAILGCYNGQNIYIYDIQDERLAGIRPTTAAHEMLHVAYQRLSGTERKRVDGLLNAEYEKLIQDTELADRMAFYDRTQSGQRENELHSIIGTEIENISPELEEYYSQYFSDRSKVLAERQQYYSVFAELRERADMLSKKIDDIGATIRSDQAEYSRAITALQSRVSSFNARATSGGFESQAEFNRERQSLLAESAKLDALRSKINNAIMEHNQLVGELNEIAIETEDLNHSIDSNFAPEPIPQVQNG